MQTKTTVRYNFSPVLLAKHQNSDIILCWQDFRGNRHSHNLIMRIQNGITPMKGNLAVSSKMSYVFAL